MFIFFVDISITGFGCGWSVVFFFSSSPFTHVLVTHFTQSILIIKFHLKIVLLIKKKKNFIGEHLKMNLQVDIWAECLCSSHKEMSSVWQDKEVAVLVNIFYIETRKVLLNPLITIFFFKFWVCKIMLWIQCLKG